MAKVLRLGLVLVGAFLLVMGLLLQFYVAPGVQKTPLDVDSTTRLTGEAELNGPDGVETFPVKAASITRADSEASDGDVVVFENSSCVVRDEPGTPDCVSAEDPEGRLLTASTGNFATDRKTALAINDPEYLPADATPREGLINKWPFDAEKKNYPYWDGTVGESVEAEYTGEDEIDGLEVYTYDVVVDDAPAEISSGIEGTYSSERTISVEPRTGSIIRQTENQSRYTEDGELFLSLSLAFTDETVEGNVDEANETAPLLKLLTGPLPLVVALIGLLMVVAGVVLQLRSRESGTSSSSSAYGGSTRLTKTG